MRNQRLCTFPLRVSCVGVDSTLFVSTFSEKQQEDSLHRSFTIIVTTSSYSLVASTSFRSTRDFSISDDKDLTSIVLSCYDRFPVVVSFLPTITTFLSYCVSCVSFSVSHDTILRLPYTPCGRLLCGNLCGDAASRLPRFIGVSPVSGNVGRTFRVGVTFGS